jgi:uncharacterized cupredoxin-like copper-binding protein
MLAGLALVLALPTAAHAQDGKWIEIGLANFKFVPSHIVLHAGQPYVFHLVNQAKGGHNFVAPEFFRAARVETADRVKITGGEIDLGGGESTTVRLIAPRPAGTIYKVRCSHFMHEAFGMKGDIVVQ